LLLSWFKRHYPDTATRAAVHLAILGYAVPGAVLAVGIFIPIAWLDTHLVPLTNALGLSKPLVLKGTLFTMLLALVIRFLAVAFQSTDSAMQRVTRSQHDASRSLGMNARQTLGRVYIPLLRSGLLTA